MTMRIAATRKILAASGDYDDLVIMLSTDRNYYNASVVRQPSIGQTTLPRPPQSLCKITAERARRYSYFNFPASSESLPVHCLEMAIDYINNDGGFAEPPAVTSF